MDKDMNKNRKQPFVEERKKTGNMCVEVINSLVGTCTAETR